ncbi:HalOD1 output domain-containing protein [Halobaculum halobium]|uniref:HalOD1 output domain-containing protein n=1 Tax=Halobaculum halobium TaxID=3032281 RepID=A0ABD5TBA5_9EURY|nr:HalOD1 output domain-containing protein [Halobaculum sp. SYNS20]
MIDKPASRADTDERQQLSHVVIESVAAATECSAHQLPPLHEAIDPDALNNLFASEGRTGGRSGGGHVSFRYHGCTVTVHASGRSVVERITDGEQ